MAVVRMELMIEAPASFVWDAFRDLGAVHERLLASRVAATRMEGDVRVHTFIDGRELRERIVSLDDESRRVAYTVLPGGRMELIHHQATFQVFEEGDARCRLVWITDLVPDSLAAEVGARMEAGIQEIKQTIERRG